MVKKTEWTAQREQEYKKSCYQIAWDKNITLIVKNNAVFYRKNGEEIKLCIPTQLKSFWYEIWLELKNNFSY